VRQPNNAISTASKKRRSFVAPLFTVGYGVRWASDVIALDMLSHYVNAGHFR
jgi:hypothetical protein